MIVTGNGFQFQIMFLVQFNKYVYQTILFIFNPKYLFTPYPDFWKHVFFFSLSQSIFNLILITAGLQETCGLTEV